MSTFTDVYHELFGSVPQALYGIDPFSAPGGGPLRMPVGSPAGPNFNIGTGAPASDTAGLFSIGKKADTAAAPDKPASGGIGKPASPPAATAPGATPPATATAAPGTAAFFQQHLPYAQQAATAAGWSAALAPVMLGIAANEGAAAQGTLANAPYNNVFGIKATPDWQGGIVRMPTTEYVNGQPVTQQATFRTYPTPQESYGDFITFLQQNARYGPALQAFQQGGDWRDFVRGLHAAGYASDPNWANKVIGIGEQAQNNQPWLQQNDLVNRGGYAPSNPADLVDQGGRSGDQRQYLAGATPNPAGQALLQAAMSYQGVNYVWGGTARNPGVDCSGLIIAAARDSGHPLQGRPTAQGIYNQAVRVDPNAVQPGDLVFFEGTAGANAGERISHVGIVTEQGMMLNAPQPGSTVSIAPYNSAFWAPKIVGFGRLP